MNVVDSAKLAAKMAESSDRSDPSRHLRGGRDALGSWALLKLLSEDGSAARSEGVVANIQAQKFDKCLVSHGAAGEPRTACYRRAPT
jgi:hypothetical protein